MALNNNIYYTLGRTKLHSQNLSVPPSYSYAPTTLSNFNKSLVGSSPACF